jgi:hypothetical protein
MKFLYHVTIVWRGAAKSADQLRGILDLADDWISLGLGFYVICTQESIYDWQMRFIAAISQEDSCFISNFSDTEETGGWMPERFWQWLSGKRRVIDSAHSFALPLPVQPPKR